MDEIEKLDVRLEFFTEASANRFVRWALNHGLRMIDMTGDKTIEIIGLHSGDFNEVMRAAADHNVLHTLALRYIPAAPLPSARVYADRVSHDEVYVGRHLMLVMETSDLGIRCCDHPVLAPFTTLAMMADLDSIGLAATGALPSELVN